MSDHLALRTPDEPEVPVALPERGRMTIGSSPDRNDLVLASQGVAEIHCVIARTKDGGWAVQDMGSEFGTILDGQRVEVARLHAGQTMVVGSVTLEVVDLMASSQPSEEVAPPEPQQTPDPVPSPSVEPEPELEEQATDSTFLEIPGYSIQETLGRGGMGAVFRARQDRLHRDVALKILSPRLAADTEFVRRFHREAQSAAAFNHPNVVTVYDVGEASGTHYLAMEYMDGESLEELLSREGRLPWKTVAEMLLGAARGLVYAESRGIVHRDIKPSNLMLNSDGQVKLADLGLAQRADDDSGDGRVFGTPHFMPPEQIRSETVDRRSDIYSLGATGYRLLSGYTPFEGVSSREILRAVLTEEFEPLRVHVTGIPSPLTDLIERMIARSPESRPQSAESVVSHLEAVLSGRSAPTAPVITAAPKGSNKNGLVAAGVLGLAAVGWFLWKNASTPPAPQPGPEVAQEPTREPDPGPDPVDPEPENGRSTTTPGEDDVAEKMFEIEAENEFLRLQSSELTLSDRQAALLALAQKFNGTTAAAEARREAEGVAEVLRMESEAEAAIASRREAVLLALHAASGLDTEPPRPGDSFLAMAAVPNQELLEDDEAFLTERQALRAAVCTRALTQAQPQLDEARTGLSDPDPTRVRESLQDLVMRLNLPDIPFEERPEGFEDLRQISADARELLRNLDAHREQLFTGNARDDTLAIAAACRSDEGIERGLSFMRPGESATRLEALAAGLSTEDAKKSVSALAEDLGAAAAALTALSDEFDSWRRKSIADPRPRRSNTEVVSISADGIEVQADSAPERIEWSAFADQPDALHQLFLRRLERSWTDEEERGIAVLIRHAAVLNTLRVTRSAFEDPSALSARDVERLLSAYEPASNWAKQTLQTDLLEREVAAAQSLTKAIELAGAEQWASATSTLEQTSQAYSDTLLLLMLSDGTSESTSDSPPPTSEDQPTPPSGLDPEGPAVPSPPDPGGE